MSTPHGYAAARPHVLPDSLDELVGPEHGNVVLPTRLDWAPGRAYLLDDPIDAQLMYERVIREALRVDDLCQYLNRDLLVRLWPKLFLSPRLPRCWARCERRAHQPVLRSADGE